MASIRSGLRSHCRAVSLRPWQFQLERSFSMLRLAPDAQHGGERCHTAQLGPSPRRSRLASVAAFDSPAAHYTQTRTVSSGRVEGSDYEGGLASPDELLTDAELLAVATGGAEDPSAGEVEGGDAATVGIGGGGSGSGEGIMAFGPPGIGFARPVPVSASYFSQQPHFTDSSLRLQALFRQYKHLPAARPEQVEQVAWKNLRDYQRNLGEEVKVPQYNRCIAMAKHLHKIHPALKPAAVVEALSEFMRDINPFANVAKPLTIDRFGRAVGVGRRKTSVARAWVVEGTGEVIVNGKSLSDAFGRVHDRESATWALRATARTDKYNIWALVAGGGTTGQAEALTLAVAKGLVAHEPALKTALRKAGCIARDPRMVERKKHGHVKARKMPTWVKR